MPICSYLIQPAPGTLDRLRTKLEAVPGCTAVPAERHDLLVLITDTVTGDEEEALQDTLKQLPEIQCMALTFGDLESEPAPSALERKGARHGR